MDLDSDTGSTEPAVDTQPVAPLQYVPPLVEWHDLQENDDNVLPVMRLVPVDPVGQASRTRKKLARNLDSVVAADQLLLEGYDADDSDA